MKNLLGQRKALLCMTAVFIGVLMTSDNTALGFQVVDVVFAGRIPKASQSCGHGDIKSSISSISSTGTGRTRLYAKKKKNKAKKGAKQLQQQQSGFAWAASFSLKPYEAQSTRDLVNTAVASFQGRTGKPLCEEIVGATDIPKALWKASMACVVVGPEDDDEEEAENKDDAST